MAVRYLFAGMGLEDEVVSYSKDPSEFLDGRLVPPGMADLTGVESRMVEFVYGEGYAQATEMYAAGGWEAIQRWTARVRTTRDLLHPDAAALPPVTFPETEPPVAGFVLRDTDSLGEQGVITLVSLLSGKDNLALQAGDGWHGDQLRRWEPARGQQGVTEWLTRWVSEDDVEDFDYALTKTLRLRFPDHEVRQLEDGTRILDTAHQQVVIERSELLVRLEIRPQALLVPPPADSEPAAP